MPVRVRASDGSIVEFPDDVTDEEIAGEMRRLDQEFDAQQRSRAPQRQPQPQAPQRGQSRDLQTEFTQTLASINRGIPFAQDVQNVIRGGVSMAQGGTFQEGVDQQRRENRELQSDFRTRRPYAAAFAEGTGNAVPVIATMGAAAPATVTTQTASRGLPLLTEQAGRGLAGTVPTTWRGFPLWLEQTARGASIGSAQGAIYGGTTGDAPSLGWEDRLGRANQGAALGGVLGAAAPTVSNTVTGTASVVGGLAEPAWRAAMRGGGALRRTAEQIPTPAPNSVGMSGGNLAARPSAGALRPPPAPPSPPVEPIHPAQINFIDRLRRSERMSVDDVQHALEQARERPQGQAVIDLFRNTGTRTFRPIVQGPGQTSGRAEDFTQERFREAAGRVFNAIRRGLGVGESRTQAIARLERDYADISRNLYNPLWARETTPQQMTAFQRDLQPIMRDPIMQAAIRRGERIFERERLLGMHPEESTLELGRHLPRYMHYVKLGLDDVVRIGRSGGDSVDNIPAIQATELTGVNALRSRFIERMDEIVPGYQQARRQWAGRAAAEDALDEGGEMLGMRPEEVQQRFDQLRARNENFLIDHLRIGLADEIINATRGGTNRNVNVARALDDPNYQQVIAAAFDTPAQAAEFLSLINGANRGSPGLYRLLNNAIQWQGGSSTVANALHAADGATQAGVDAGVNLLRGNPAGAAQRGIDWARNQATLGMMERANNRRGEVALRRIDTEESRGFALEVVRLLREREVAEAASRAAASQSSSQAGIVGGTRE
jgi:hypothetical protein